MTQEDDDDDDPIYQCPRCYGEGYVPEPDQVGFTAMELAVELLYDHVNEITRLRSELVAVRDAPFWKRKRVAQDALDRELERRPHDDDA